MTPRTLATEPFLIASAPVGPFAMNQYLIACTETGEGAIIDSGGPPEPFVDYATEHGVTIAHLLQTHAHIDHVAGLAQTKARLSAPIYLHSADRQVYETAAQRGAMFGFRIDAPPPPDRVLADGDVLRVGTLEFEVWHTPGHCPGHVCFVERRHRIVFDGDLLFRRSIGRTDFPECEPEKMGPSLSRLMTLSDDTVLYPGHMEPTTVGEERRENPLFDVLAVVR